MTLSSKYIVPCHEDACLNSHHLYIYLITYSDITSWYSDNPLHWMGSQNISDECIIVHGQTARASAGNIPSTGGKLQKIAKQSKDVATVNFTTDATEEQATHEAQAFKA